MDKLPPEIVNYLCTFLPVKTIKATFSDEQILESGVALDLWKLEMIIKDKIQKVMCQIELHETGINICKERCEFLLNHQLLDEFGQPVYSDTPEAEETILMNEKMFTLHLDLDILLGKVKILKQALSCL